MMEPASITSNVEGGFGMATRAVSNVSFSTKGAGMGRVSRIVVAIVLGREGIVVGAGLLWWWGSVRERLIAGVRPSKLSKYSKRKVMQRIDDIQLLRFQSGVCT